MTDALASLRTARAGLDACVHCGFCLQACPTYLATGDENDSPRGRIVLMRAALDAALPLEDPALTSHLDRCLGCRACETACPSGVPYGECLEAARATLHETARAEPFAARALLWLVAHLAVFAPLMAIARALRATPLPRLLARASFPMAMLAGSAPVLRPHERGATAAPTRARVALLDGCVMRGLFSHVHEASAGTLAENGYALVSAPGQACCGALHAHAGHADEARALARAQIAAFEKSGAECIAVDAAGCGAMMKEYGRLLADDPAWRDRAAEFSKKVRDVSELLAAAGPVAGAAIPLRVTYDAPCHLLHAQRVSAPPLTVLAAVPGLELVPLTDADQCCGSAGIYNLEQPALAADVLAPNLRHIADTGANVVATGNPGCQMQIGGGLIRAGVKTRVVHPVELLWASYGGARERTRTRLDS